MHCILSFAGFVRLPTKSVRLEEERRRFQRNIVMLVRQFIRAVVGEEVRNRMDPCIWFVDPIFSSLYGFIILLLGRQGQMGWDGAEMSFYYAC